MFIKTTKLMQNNNITIWQSGTCEKCQGTLLFEGLHTMQ